MTTEEITALPVGRKLDALVHERVMGKTAEWIAKEECELKTGSEYPLGFTTNFGGAVFTNEREWLVNDYIDPDDNMPVPEYSTDIAAAWEVVDCLSARGMGIVIEDWRFDSMGWLVGLELPGGHTSAQTKADSAPLAICRAALLATGSE